MLLNGTAARQFFALQILSPFFLSVPGSQLRPWLPSELLRLLRQCFQLWQGGVKEEWWLGRGWRKSPDGFGEFVGGCKMKK